MENSETMGSNPTLIEEAFQKISYVPTGTIPFGLGRRKVDLQELKPVHEEILRRKMLGQKNVEIAKELGVTRETVSLAKNSTVGALHLRELSARRDDEVIALHREIQEYGRNAFETLQEIMEDAETGKALKTKVAMDLLDRAGFGAVQKVSSVSTKLSSDDLSDLIAKAKAEGITVESSPIPTPLESEALPLDETN